jgi:GNAT superfamily N-acetyltransferase
VSTHDVLRYILLILQLWEKLKENESFGMDMYCYQFIKVTALTVSQEYRRMGLAKKMMTILEEGNFRILIYLQLVRRYTILISSIYSSGSPIQLQSICTRNLVIRNF